MKKLFILSLSLLVSSMSFAGDCEKNLNLSVNPFHEKIYETLYGRGLEFEAIKSIHKVVQQNAKLYSIKLNDGDSVDRFSEIIPSSGCDATDKGLILFFSGGKTSLYSPWG